MASRKFLIDGILGLAQKIGANPNKFMGTKQNINFLGTGDRGMKGTTFSGLINEEVIGATNTFGKSDLVKIIEQDMGFVTAGKLNDVQLNTMLRNLKTIDNTFNPPPGPMNIIDLVAIFPFYAEMMMASSGSDGLLVLRLLRLGRVLRLLKLGKRNAGMIIFANAFTAAVWSVNE